MNKEKERMQPTKDTPVGTPVKYHAVFGYLPEFEGTFAGIDDDPRSRCPYLVRIEAISGSTEIVSCGACEIDRPDIKKDHNLWVWNGNSVRWAVRRHFSHWGKNGRAVCYMDGRTSHTNTPGTDLGRWKHYSFTDPNKESS